MTTILTKKKDTSGAPAPGDLTNAAGGAELAVNTADKRLYTKDAGGNVVEIGTNPTILNIDNIQIDGNTISSTNTNGDVNITPNGTGSVVISKLSVTGNTTLGDASGDSLTTNTGTWTINNDITINTNLMYWDRANNRVGFGGTTAPAFAIHSAGGGLFSGSYSTATDPVYSGVSLGFEGTGNIGVIASTNPSSATLSLRTKKGATFAPVERINIDENGVIRFRNTNSETSGTQITIGSVSMSSVLNIVPDGNVVQNLGSASNRWANVFASTLSDGTNLTMVSSSGANMHLAAGSSWTSTIVYVSGSPKVYFNSNGIGVGAASSATDLLLTDGTSTLTIDAAANSEIIANGSTGFTLNASNASGQIFFRTAGAQRGQVSPSGQWTVGGVVSNPAASANLIVNNGTTGASTSGEHVLVVGNVNNTVGSERGAGVYLFAQNAATGGSDQASILFAHRNNAGTGEGPFSGIRSYKDSGSDTSNLTFRYGSSNGTDSFAGALYGNGRWGFGSSVTEAQTNTTQAAVSVYGAFVAGQLSPYTRYTYIGATGALTSRFDDNAMVGPIKMQNLGMTATGHGVFLDARLATDGINDYNGGSIEFASVGAYTSTASTQDSEIRMRVAVDGNNTTVATFTNAGNLAMAQADKGIDFSVNSAAAGATSEVLNDYEEGTWTPTILYGGSDTGQTYAIQNGRYVKVGSIVHAQGYAQTSVNSSATGSLSMGGFPFTSANVTDYRIIGAAMIDNAATAIDQPVGQMTGNATTVLIISGTGANNATALTDTARGGSFRVFVSITYRVS